MAYNETLANRIRGALTLFPEKFTEKKMFGGIAFLLEGKMTVGAINDDLMVRVISTKMNNVLNQEHVRPMDFTGKPMKEFVFVAMDGCQTEEQLQQWIELGVEHAKSKLKNG
ncbi:TfoX/Sxy family protein [Allomuricauda sp. d1]|uniref:TfoX/Sxy family protein n=1 Tax=Allomuricauda sp. d1 TaxID=3136725 RepID=UPI0031DC6765